MSAFWTLWFRELAAYFRTGIGYVIGTTFLAIAGISLWVLATNLAQGPLAGDLAGNLFGSTGYWLAILLVTPLLTMRLFAEERRMGTLPTLLVAPIGETTVVLAKFAAAYTMFIALWLPTLVFAVLLRRCGAHLPPLDWGPVAAGYLGTALVGALFLAIGLLCSLLTRHQAIAAMACLGVLSLLLTGGLLPLHAPLAAIRQLAHQLAAPRHMADFAVGIVDTRVILWYASATLLLLFTAVRLLEVRRLR
ncbi:MAG TPA: ABC transporter permease subunit [Kiritimatiellia bacterium]|nr:ABC transporter permease subunit [Kiritimatiellia bacterium]